MEPDGRDAEATGRRLGAPRPPRISPETALALVEDQHRRHEAFLRDLRAGPFALLAERNHPLVRAEMRRTRRSRWAATAVCVAVPLAVFVVLLLAQELLHRSNSHSVVKSAGWILMLDTGVAFAHWFACFWPLVMFLGAALRAAGAVLAERSDETAVQIVLTSMPKRAIAAAKILPYASPFLCGALAALPLYILEVDSLHLHGPVADAFSYGFIIWPLRMFAAPAVDRSWPPELGAHHLVSAGLMCFADLGAIWAAVHWGAALAVRKRSLRHAGRPLILNVVRMCLATCPVCTVWALTMILDPAFGTGAVLAPTVLGLLAFALLLSLSWWLLVLRHATRSVMESFAWFDYLAMEEGDRPPGARDEEVLGDTWDETARP